MSCSFIFTNEKEGPYQLLHRSQPADCIAPFPPTPFPTFGAGKERHRYHLLCLHQISPLLPTAVPQPARWVGHGEGIAQSFSATLLSSLPFSSFTLMWLYIYRKNTYRTTTYPFFSHKLSLSHHAPPRAPQHLQALCSVFWPCLSPGLSYSTPWPPNTACGAQVFPPHTAHSSIPLF